MAVYLVTGKLGSGKTLATVGRIRDYLNQGRMVATNLDLNLEKLINPWAKKSRVIRMPDKPKLHDLESLPEPYTGDYDESKTGLIVLDECGTWFNTRDYRDKERAPVIDKLLHIRKAGWDVIFIIQHIEMMDKQVRDGLGEHVVYCQRADRLGIPLITPLAKIAGMDIRPPKIHLAIVKYGTSQASPVVDRWVYNGTDLYGAYDTRQVFGANDCQMYSMMPPFLTFGRFKTKQQHAKEKSRETISKIKTFCKGAKRTFFLLGLTIGVTVNFFDDSQPSKANAETITQNEITEPEKPEETTPQQPVYNPLSGLYISGSVVTSNGIDYILYNEYEENINPESLGITLRPISSCKVVLLTGSTSRTVTCHRPAKKSKTETRPSANELLSALSE